jgi:hypothetical protein
MPCPYSCHGKFGPLSVHGQETKHIGSWQTKHIGREGQTPLTSHWIYNILTRPLTLEEPCPLM